MTAKQLIKKLQQLDPDTPVVIMNELVPHTDNYETEEVEKYATEKNQMSGFEGYMPIQIEYAKKGKETYMDKGGTWVKGTVLKLY